VPYGVHPAPGSSAGSVQLNINTGPNDITSANAQLPSAEANQTYSGLQPATVKFLSSTVGNVDIPTELAVVNYRTARSGFSGGDGKKRKWTVQGVGLA
jgi:hypothetical protein